MAKAIVVLSDGETYSDLEGSSVLIITDEAYNALGAVINDPRDLSNDMVLMELSLKDVTVK